jgi:hypothetical protein
MADYYQRRPQASADLAAPAVTEEEDLESTSLMSNYDRYRRRHITQEDDEGWASELRRYIKDIHAKVKKDIDIVEWWQVHLFPHSSFMY